MAAVASLNGKALGWLETGADRGRVATAVEAFGVLVCVAEVAAMFGCAAVD